jgi:cell division transport system permease protein
MTPAASSFTTVASMSMTKINPLALPVRKRLERLRRPVHAAEPVRAEAAIVPRDSIAANALAAVVAIMTFLAAATSGGVAMVIGSASAWQSEITREMTVQVRPVSGRDIEAEVAKAAQIVRAAPGVEEVRIYTRQESERLLEPWLGPGLSFADLPVPRMIAVRVASTPSPDATALRQALTRDVAGASLDDHRGWIDRMRRMATTAIAGGLAVFGLVLAATILAVAFATRGAMASNRPIVEVLHFVGAKDAYIAAQFQRHFLALGLKGGAIGGGAALMFLALAAPISDRFVGTAGGAEASALFGAFAIGPMGYAMVVAEVVVIAAVTALTSRKVVVRTLKRLD